MIQAMLFDLDGTLFDRTSSVIQCIEGQHQRFVTDLGHLTKARYCTRFLALDQQGYVKKELVYQQLVDEFALPGELVEKLNADFWLHYHTHAIGFADLVETLIQLRASGLKLGLITNGNAAIQQGTIHALGIHAFFDVMLISEAEGIKKPDRLIFERALQRIGVAAQAALFVGDHPVTDIAGAQKAGIKSVWKRTAAWGGCPHADWTIEVLPELIALVEAINQPKPAKARVR